jgi:hypothetical protein
MSIITITNFNQIYSTSFLNLLNPTSTITNLLVSNSTLSNLNVTNYNTTNFQTNGITVTNLNVTSSISNLVCTNISSSNISSLNTIATNISTTNLVETNYLTTNTTVTNLFINSSGFSTNPTISSFSDQGSIGGTTTASMCWIKIGPLMYVSGVLTGLGTTSSSILKVRITLPYTHTLGTSSYIGGCSNTNVSTNQNIFATELMTYSTGSSDFTLSITYSANFTNSTTSLYYIFMIPVN